jgi:hypothetical protein
MAAKLEYDSYVERLKSATVAALTLGSLVFLLVSAVTQIAASQIAVSQVNGTPASVTSPNFGGRPNSAPGTPASVTSVGPSGFQTRHQFFAQPANPNPPLSQRHHHHRQSSFFPATGAVYVPYPMLAEPETSDTSVEATSADDDRGGPTIFDRRGSGQAARSFVDDYPRSASRAQSEIESAPRNQPAETTVPDQPQTVLIFKDGHQVEVQNYAVVGNLLYDLTPGHHRKIAIADLDLKATAKQNDDLGISFQLPSAPEANK